MGVRCINIDGWTNRDYTIDQGTDILTAPGNILINTDGVHVHGPARGIRDTNGKWLNCGDDSYALNADDAWGAGSFLGRFDNVFGDITDVVVQSPYMSARYFGIRLLSGNSRIHNVFFRDVTGSTYGSAFRIDNYVTPSQTRAAGPGNVGLVVVDGWNVTTGYFDAAWGQMAMAIDCKIEQLQLKRIVKRDFNNVYFPAIRFGEKYQGDQLEVEYTSRNYNGGSYMTEQIDFAPGAQVTQADIKMRVHSSAANAGYPLRIQSGAAITQGEVRGGQINFAGMLQNNSGGAAGFVDNSKATTAAAPASTWVLQSGAPWAEDGNNPGMLTHQQAHSGSVDSARKIASDGFGGNVMMTGTVRFNSTLSAPTSGLHACFFTRGVNTVPWAGVTQAYAFDMTVRTADGTAGGCSLFKVSGGSQPVIGTAVAGVFVVNVDYKYTFITKPVSGTTTVSIMIQRGSDNLYLQPNNTWTTTAGPAITGTDTAIAAASGQWGVYGYNEANGSTSIAFTNLAISAAP